MRAYFSDWPMEDASKAALYALLARDIHNALEEVNAATAARAAAPVAADEPVH